MIVLLKQQLKSNYLAMQRAGEHLDCGHSLALIVSSDYLKYFMKCKELYRQLRAEDPECPTMKIFELNESCEHFTPKPKGEPKP